MLGMRRPAYVAHIYSNLFYFLECLYVYGFVVSSIRLLICLNSQDDEDEAVVSAEKETDKPAAKVAATTATAAAAAPAVATAVSKKPVEVYM